MNRLTRWTGGLALSALLTAVPAAGQQSEPAQTTPPTGTTAAPAQEPQDASVEAARRHLSAARDTLSQLTQLPAASQLTGDARTQVSQLITNFNELITTNVDWRASFAKVTANLTALIGDQKADESAAAPAAGTPGAVGTSGTVALDPTIRAKLAEFRAHLIEFEQAAGGGAAGGSAPSAAAATMPGNRTAPGSTSEPPTSIERSAAAAAGIEGAAGTSGTIGPGAAAPSAPEPQTRPAPATPSSTQPESKPEGHAEALRHIEAIEAILNARPQDKPTGTTGAERTGGLDRDQVEEIRRHLTELRRLVSR